MTMRIGVGVVSGWLLLIVICPSGCDCRGGFTGKLSRPAEAQVNFSDTTLTKFDGGLSKTLFRYLAGSPRWEIRQEGDLRYAVRLERVDGYYEPTLNGFYSEGSYEDHRQRRVILSFARPFGFGREHGNISRVVPGSADISLVIEGEHSGSPGNSSYTIINGGLIFLEIFDQAPELERKFTQAAFNEVCSELQYVIEYRDEIHRTGVLPVAALYPDGLYREHRFVVKDGSQPGIYIVDAAANPTEPGFAYIKAYNVKSSERLSEEEVTRRSMRYVGWSDDGKTFFPYGSEIMVFEGNWSSKYEARFELWHHSDEGTETKLAETTRMINGWER